MLIGVQNTTKELPTKTDFLFGFIQLGERFGDAMVEGITWLENEKWYFKPLMEQMIYQVDRNTITFAVAYQNYSPKPLTH